ncbi:UDP-N-acetylmuramoylalanine--D-glutamate ligase [Chlamydia ibidis]|uniref:UDP-N-acetylmuramoylalanine--D-glutamate ligase n=2 Tax=Chlamydia ibidis TaxID=1405396 RepID=S7KEQ3_9CHLA|nr:UDP-N-acetylmuramoyl-L-alanine--D-glutamate ligase [Chlamydia ibidis]EPP34661.1 UDP-N-acetylmuramoylalanine--D-glutamate ligase [Chlamydia ibidis]EQM62387.1 UDP-N-acetylmuramoylalanine--D-glutamate ligase [Chlamydia ibidis 10-1398/6]
MTKRCVIVLGAGISGRSSAKFLRQRGDYVIGVDRSIDALNACEYFHEICLEDYLDFPLGADLVVRSPGIKYSHPWVIEAKSRNIPVVTDIQLAIQTREFQEYPSLGITGSNGKTSTVLFLVHLLKTANISAFPMGNIGIPILENINCRGVRIVEISSFQLDHQEISYPVLSGGVILNISANHLDYHGTFTEYAEAKLCIKHCLKYPNELWSGEGTGCGRSYWDYSAEKLGILDKGSALKPIYLHDKSNYYAAYALACGLFDITPELWMLAVQTFKKPPHRIECLGEKNRIRYINDSKATTICSVARALVSVGPNIIVILGGRNKGGDFKSLLPELAHTTKHIVAMGECREEITSALSSALPVTQAVSLEEAVNVAESVAQSGDTILLSPGCASFDQFRSFEERGNRFKQLVGNLEALNI